MHNGVSHSKKKVVASVCMSVNTHVSSADFLKPSLEYRVDVQCFWNGVFGLHHSAPILFLAHLRLVSCMLFHFQMIASAKGGRSHIYDDRLWRNSFGS